MPKANKVDNLTQKQLVIGSVLQAAAAWAKEQTLLNSDVLMRVSQKWLKLKEAEEKKNKRLDKRLEELGERLKEEGIR